MPLATISPTNPGILSNTNISVGSDYITGGFEFLSDAVVATPSQPLGASTIADTYDSIFISFSARSNQAAATDVPATFQVAGSVLNSEHNWTFWQGTSMASSNAAFGLGSFTAPAGGSAAGDFLNMSLWFPNYAHNMADRYPMFVGLGAWMDDGESNINTAFGSGVYESTTVDVASLELYLTGGYDFAVGSWWRMYGLKK